MVNSGREANPPPTAAFSQRRLLRLTCPERECRTGLGPPFSRPERVWITAWSVSSTATPRPASPLYLGTVYIFQFPAFWDRPGRRRVKKQYTVPRFPRFRPLWLPPGTNGLSTLELGCKGPKPLPGLAKGRRTFAAERNVLVAHRPRQGSRPGCGAQPFSASTAPAR